MQTLKEADAKTDIQTKAKEEEVVTKRTKCYLVFM